MMPRLSQPLFATENQKRAKEDLRLYSILRAYDCIWTMLYKPEDITPEQRMQNAKANLQSLGTMLENACTAEIFEQDPRQLSLPEELLDVTQPITLG